MGKHENLKVSRGAAGGLRPVCRLPASIPADGAYRNPILGFQNVILLSSRLCTAGWEAEGSGVRPLIPSHSQGSTLLSYSPGRRHSKLGVQPRCSLAKNPFIKWGKANLQALTAEQELRCWPWQCCAPAWTRMSQHAVILRKERKIRARTCLAAAPKITASPSALPRNRIWNHSILDKLEFA